MTDPLRPIHRSLNLLRYHRKRQFLHRATRLVRRSITRWTGLRAPAVRRTPVLRGLAGFLSFAHRKAACRPIGWQERAAALHQSRFALLNQTRALTEPIDWRLSEQGPVEHLWRFRLHEQEYLLDLLADATDGQTSAASTARTWKLVHDWIAGNELRDLRELDDAWHPYCISRRLPVWMALWHGLGPPVERAEEVLTSMYAQATHLVRNLEWELGGNHLLDNARALALAGAFFAGDEPDRWLSRAAKIFQAELPQQVLSHGEHFERAPMYHCQVLEMLLDVAEVTVEMDPLLASLCRDYATRMASFLDEILHPDGDIPLLGDSCFHQGTPPRMLIDFARGGPRSKVAKPERTEGATVIGDYWVFGHDQDSLLFDAGSVAADWLPAHGHCDLLGIELSLNGKRFLVDSGVFNYEADDMRRYCRSTAAHNVLEIDGQETCDVWSKFRMGARGTPSRLISGKQGDTLWAKGAHNGYRRIGVPSVERWVHCHPGRFFLIADAASGTGQHRLCSYLHFHPDVRVEQDGDRRLGCQLGEDRIWVELSREAQLELQRGWYCPEFGRRVETVVACGIVEAELPAGVTWVVSKGNPVDRMDPEELLRQASLD